MTYIVLDLEWNQAMSSQASIFNKLPIHLRGEIIQIGAVKLKDDMTPGEEFQTDVRPVFFRRMHYKVKKLTGIDKERMMSGESFETAMERFWQWCGPDCVYLTWGYDDKGIMEQNLIVHDMDIDWMGRWINLQLIYNRQVPGDSNQKSLSTAMEHFAIDQTRVAHDALGDAYNTALVCSKLDLLDGLEHYDDCASTLPRKAKLVSVTPGDAPEPIEHTVSAPHDSREELWADETVTGLCCPECGARLDMGKWVSQGDKRYMSSARCGEHGDYLLRIRVRHEEDDTWTANRLVYKCDESMSAYYEAKSAHPRRRRGRSKKK